MSEQELRQILRDLQFHADPQYSQDEFAGDVIDSMIETVLDGRMQMNFANGVVSYCLTEEGKQSVEDMGK